jgi:hypothetical protein
LRLQLSVFKTGWPVLPEQLRVPEQAPEQQLAELPLVQQQA